MNIFKIKNAKFCKFLIALFIILVTVFPFLVLTFEFLALEARLAVCLVLLILCVFVLVKFFRTAFTSELVLKIIDANNKMRTKFELPESVTKEKIEKKVLRFGKEAEPTPVFPKPELLRYQFKTPVTGNAKGIETIISTYSIPKLTNSDFKNIIKSAKNNSRNLKGKKKTAIYLDSQQKKAPLKRTDIILIFANSVDATFEKHLFDIICKEDADGFNESIIPCVFNFSNNTIVFNCVWLPDAFSEGYARNRGIKIIKNKLLKNNLDFKHNENYVEFKQKDIDREQTLWQLLKSQEKEFKNIKKEENKRFKNMKDREVAFEDDFLYIKLGEKGVALYSEINEESKTVSVDSFEFWDYPKANQISKNAVSQIQNLTVDYFLNEGYTVKFISTEE